MLQPLFFVFIISLIFLLSRTTNHYILCRCFRDKSRMGAEWVRAPLEM
jgi:hypothetical protein